MMGTIVVDEQVFPVVGITLHDGAFIVTAELQGPKEVREGIFEMRLHDNEGHTVLVTKMHQDRVVAAEHDRITLEFTCRVLNKEIDFATG